MDEGAAVAPSADAHSVVRRFLIRAGAATPLQPDEPVPDGGYLWIEFDLLGTESDAATLLRQTVLDATGVQLFDAHIQDALNPQQPSFYEATADYAMLVFRRLVMGDLPPLAEQRGTRRVLQPIDTSPVAFFVFPAALVSVRSGLSRSFDHVRSRLLAGRAQGADTNDAARTVQPFDLLLRLLNALVDRYLELREPFSDKLDDWQQQLIDPRRPFRQWAALLEARIELRRLENLCEGQYDALLEMRDDYLEHSIPGQYTDGHLVRLNDVIEHVDRVLKHAHRLEATAESAVQLHFSAATHETNQIIRTLTLITAIFLPLTLITGIFGMNFERMPLIGRDEGFWWTIGAMVTLAVVLVFVFWWRRWLAQPRRLRQLTPRRWRR